MNAPVSIFISISNNSRVGKSTLSTLPIIFFGNSLKLNRKRKKIIVFVTFSALVFHINAQEKKNYEMYNVFEHMAITGTHVNVRNNPHLKTSEVVGQFSYDIVKVDYEKSISIFDETIWYYTKSLDGNYKATFFGITFGLQLGIELLSSLLTMNGK